MTILVAGAGIGGLSCALSLHAAGFDDILIIEAAAELQPLGVGVNLPPHAVRELSELGLEDQLRATGVEIETLDYFSNAGTHIWTDPRGLSAGFHWPQYAIHRGQLQMLLLNAVKERLGVDRVKLGTRLMKVVSEPTGVTVELKDAPAPGSTRTLRCEFLIGADGIQSTTRREVSSVDNVMRTNGFVMYRGATQWDPFRGGNSMAIIGDEARRAVVYPIEKETTADRRLTNWIVSERAPRGEDPLGVWTLRADAAEVERSVAGWRFPWLDVTGLVGRTQEIFRYPMVDLEPLESWGQGRATLIGDAAHAMYPFGSNGASQAIIDGRVLAFEMAQHGQIEGARAYERDRRPITSGIQAANRRQASEVMKEVGRLCAMGRLHDAAAVLEASENEYRSSAGTDPTALNARRSLTV